MIKRSLEIIKKEKCVRVIMNVMDFVKYSLGWRLLANHIQTCRDLSSATLAFETPVFKVLHSYHF